MYVHQVKIHIKQHLCCSGFYPSSSADARSCTCTNLQRSLCFVAKKTLHRAFQTVSLECIRTPDISGINLTKHDIICFIMKLSSFTQILNNVSEVYRICRYPS